MRAAGGMHGGGGGGAVGRGEGEEIGNWSTLFPTFCFPPKSRVNCMSQSHVNCMSPTNHRGDEGKRGNGSFLGPLREKILATFALFEYF